MKSIVFWDWPPAFTLVSCSAYSSTLKMETICSSETPVDFQRTTRRYIPEDGTQHINVAGFMRLSRGDCEEYSRLGCDAV
jgi:hypothetical protein